MTRPEASDVAREPKVLVYRSRALGLSETFIREQLSHLQRWKAVLVAELVLEDGLDLDGLEVRVIPAPRIFPRSRGRLQRYLGLPSLAAVRLLRKEGASLVHVHFGTEALKAWPLAKALKLPMLVTLHGYDVNVNAQWWQAGKAGHSLRRYPERLLAIAAEPDVHFLAVSEPIRRQAIRIGVPETKITLSHIGVDTERFRPSGKPIGERDEILFVGRLVEKKGCRYLIEAWASLQERFPQVRLVIVGDGRLRPELTRLAKDLNVLATFTGAMTSSQVAERMARARIFCLPSITADSGDAEGLPISILEAQSAGVPVVTSARGGATEGIVPGVSGFAFEERDAAGLAECLAALMADDQLAESMGRAGRTHIIENHDVRACTGKLERLYTEHSKR